MKRYSFIIVTILLIMVVTNTAFAYSVPMRGEYNEEVIQIHQKLSELGYYGLRPESPWSEASENASKLTIATLNYIDGVDADSADITDDDLNRIMSAKGPLNLVWDGNFENVEKYWSKWGNPMLVDTVEINEKKWMHLVSSGTRWEGLKQDYNNRSGTEIQELIAGSTYKLTFIAFAADNSIGKEITCGLHNINLIEGKNQEQYWTTRFVLSGEPTEFEYIFKANMSGPYRIMIGEGLEEAVEAFYTDIMVIKQ